MPEIDLKSDNARAIALYLPQFYPVPINNELWGKGFTEWNLVTKAKPLFPGHAQPRLPSDLGFYDLRVPEIQIEQARLAKQAGLGGFCYYHYWFNGERALEYPEQNLLADKKIEFPFCLCWANHDWNAAWLGQDEKILLKQTYDPTGEDDIKHIDYLIPYFKDERYIRINGKPLFVFYDANKIPNLRNVITRWRQRAYEYKIELHLLKMENFDNDKIEPNEHGFDGSLEWHPLRKLFNWDNKLGCQILAYEEYVKIVKNKPPVEYERHPAVCVSWDNTPRRGVRGGIFSNSNPHNYENWLQATIDENKEKLVFIYAWNEWSEGNILEPCQQWGNSFLKATQKVLKNEKSKFL